MSLATRLAEGVVRRPGRVLLVCAALTALVAPLLARLRLDTDPLHLIPESGAAQAFGRFAKGFAGDRLLVVLVEGDDPDALVAFADRYADVLARLPEVASVRAKLGSAAAGFLRAHLLQLLTDEELAALAPRFSADGLSAKVQRIRSLLAAPGGSSLAPLVTTDPLELLPAVAARLQGGLAIDARSGYFLAADRRALLLYVRPKAPSADTGADRALLVSAAREAERLGAQAAGLRISFAGACAYALTWRDWLERDGSLSTTLSAVAVLLLFALLFRSLRVLPLVAAPLAVGLLWTGAAAGALFGHLNAVSLTFGTVLLSIGIDFPIQIYNRLREELRTRPPLEALAATVSALAGPSVAATLGPSLVFFACGLAKNRGLAELGLLAGLGLGLNLIAMLTVFPSLLAILPPALWACPDRREPGHGLLAAIGRASARRPRRVLAASALAFLACLPIASRLRVEERLISLQPPSMPPVQADRAIAHHFGPRDRMLVALVEDVDPERALERADAWRAEAEELRRAGLIAGYQSVASLVPSSRTQQRRRAALAALDPAAAARALGARLESAGLDSGAFRPFLAQLESAPPPITLDEARAAGLDFLLRSQLSDEGGIRRVATFLFPPEGAPPSALRARLDQFAAGPAGGVVTGLPILEETLHALVVRDTRVVTLASTVAVALLLALWYRRARPWLAVMAPLALAWIGFAALLVLARIELDLFNLIAVPLVIGYGIDDHVFLVHRYERDRDAARALSTTGRAIVLTSLSTMAGFGGLWVARFEGLRRFGLSGALAVALCLVAAFAVLPALLTLLWPPRR